MHVLSNAQMWERSFKNLLLFYLTTKRCFYPKNKRVFMIGHIIVCLDRICILRVQNLYSSRTEFAKVHFLKTYKNRIIKHAKLNYYTKDRSILSISIIPYRVRSLFCIFVLRRYIAYILIAV